MPDPLITFMNQARVEAETPVTASTRETLALLRAYFRIQCAERRAAVLYEIETLALQDERARRQ